jgi:hypothetical protein
MGVNTKSPAEYYPWTVHAIEAGKREVPIRSYPEFRTSTWMDPNQDRE